MRNSQMAKVGKHLTTITKSDSGYTYIRYVDTNVVAFNEFEIRIRANGYYTPTTVRRIEQASNQFNLGIPKLSYRNTHGKMGVGLIITNWHKKNQVRFDSALIDRKGCRMFLFDRHGCEIMAFSLKQKEVL